MAGGCYNNSGIKTMLPIHHIENFLQFASPQLQEIVLELRNVIFSVAPDTAEVVRWGGLSYFHEGRGGIVSAGICQIEIHKEHVRLAFIHGAFLPDPHKLFRGTQKYKRFIEIDSYDNAPWDYLKKLVSSASKFDPRLMEKIKE
jgi:hypothetical protein